MPALTRRRDPDRPDCWQVYYGDVCIGTISRRSGCPVDVDQWGWICGFYPGMEPGDYQDGTAIDFGHARADFEAAWRLILPTKANADFQAWRDQREPDGMEICHVGCRDGDADAGIEWLVTMLLRRAYRHRRSDRTRPRHS